METRSNLPPAYQLPGEFKNITTGKAALTAARGSGERLVGSLAGSASFAQILAQESEKQRKLQTLREGPREEEKRPLPIF